jgi:cysteine desulfurase
MAVSTYLDHNATTPVAPEVLEAMLPYLSTAFGNPSSDHELGRQAARAVATAREQVAVLIGSHPDEIVFTSGGTESNNLAIRGAAAAADPARRRILTSAVEHPATTEPLAALRAEGWAISAAPVTPAGHVSEQEAAALLAADVALVTVMLAQNETGAIMPVGELADAGRAVGALTHTDAAQAVGKIPVDVEALGVDLLSIAGHKCYAPKGVGALYLRRGTPLAPVLRGAGQERGVRPGTENVAGVVALGAACEIAQAGLATEPARLSVLRDGLWDHLSAAVPSLVRFTPTVSALPNTLLVAFPDVVGRDVLAASPTIAAATGSACHSGEERPSATVLAMGVAPELAVGTVRLSLGRSTTADDVARAAAALAAGYRAARGR